MTLYEQYLKNMRDKSKKFYLDIATIRMLEYISWAPSVELPNDDPDYWWNKLWSDYQEKGYFTEEQKSRVLESVEELYISSPENMPERMRSEFRVIYENKIEEYFEAFQ